MDTDLEFIKNTDKELQLIRQQDFVSFFLINWKIVQYAKTKNFYHVGRGSGANSIVAYLLGITDVDPIELDLYFPSKKSKSKKSLTMVVTTKVD